MAFGRSATIHAHTSGLRHLLWNSLQPRHPSVFTQGKVTIISPPLPLLDGETVIEMEPDADNLTKRFTQQAVKFIEANKEEPFFLYLPHPVPHSPLHASAEFMSNVSDRNARCISR